MGLLAMVKAMAKSSTTSAHNTGMDLLLVFFPEDNSSVPNKTKLFPSPFSSSSSSSTFRRTNSKAILSKAQSTISICALLLFITLLLFTLSTFEPTIPVTSSNALPHTTPRRLLLRKPPHTLHIVTKSKTHNSLPKLERNKSHNASRGALYFPSTALQRMGTLYRRGTRAMSDLIVGHVAEDTTDDELRLFLRVLHRSGLTARADVVFIFASASSTSRFAAIIREENDAFLSLIDLHSVLKLTRWSQEPESNFDLTRFLKVGKKGVEVREPLWGKKIRSNFSNPEVGESNVNDGVTQLSYGSVLSFDATELDPENSLAGFLDDVPLSLRRWACYPLLLGRVRRNFKHVMLVDVKNLVIVNDPLGRVSNRSPESIFLYTKAESDRHNNKNSEKTQSQRPVNSAIVMGSARGIRRLSNAMLTEIVRVAMKHKKNSVSESAILSQLVGNEFMLQAKHINLITLTESIPDASSLGGRNSAGSTSLSDCVIIQRGTSNHDINSVIKKKLCSSVVDSAVYKDC